MPPTRAARCTTCDGRGVGEQPLGFTRPGEVVVAAAGHRHVRPLLARAWRTTTRPRNPAPPVTTTRRPLQKPVMTYDATTRRAMMGCVRVAYTLEQCWHRMPGGTGVAALRIAEALGPHNDVRLIGVAGRHRHLPPEPWVPTDPGRAPADRRRRWLYEAGCGLNWPKVERPPARSTSRTPPRSSRAPPMPSSSSRLHDSGVPARPVAVHQARRARLPAQPGSRSSDRADLVLCCSQATMDDCVAAGIVRRPVAAGAAGRGDRACHRTREWPVCDSSTACPSATCCSSARSSRART
jgi:hypothetical protein